MKTLTRMLAVILALCLGCAAASAQPDPANGDDVRVEDAYLGADFDPTIAAENGFNVKTDDEGNYKVVSGASAALESVLGLLKLFFFNLLVSFIIIHFLYYPKSHRRD